ncbi:MAG: flagellar basal body rod protein FlgC [Campylobacterota bacterium]|nr:flagellar basal body rod protein FlgC [Campylobacterota bacterium]
MGFFDGYNVATSGMSAQRTRINIVSSNIANAQTTHSKDGGPYKKQNVIFEEVLLEGTKKDKEKSPDQIDPLSLRGVGVREILEAKDAPILKYEPEHPDANKDGYVAYPNINPVIEMVDLIEAMRSYEANVSAFKTQKEMDTKTLDIIKM